MRDCDLAPVRSWARASFIFSAGERRSKAGHTFNLLLPYPSSMAGMGLLFYVPDNHRIKMNDGTANLELTVAFHLVSGG